MNKFCILIAGLVVFAAVVQLSSAQDRRELVNELPDDREIDEDLEGGGFSDTYNEFKTKARKAVGTNVKAQWGQDIQNPAVGQAKLATPRQRGCSHAKTEKVCKSCCLADEGKSYSFKTKLPGIMSSCTCYSTDNNYSL